MEVEDRDGNLNGYAYHDRFPAFNVVFDEEKLLEANRRHDAAAHTVSMDRKAHYRNAHFRIHGN